MRAPETVTYAKHYASRIWLSYRLGYLSRNLTCGCGERTSEVAHKHRHRGCWRDFLDAGNHVALCSSCYANHTAGN